MIPNSKERRIGISKNLCASVHYFYARGGTSGMCRAESVAIIDEVLHDAPNFQFSLNQKAFLPLFFIISCFIFELSLNALIAPRSFL
jgi:hypothetical protein